MIEEHISNEIDYWSRYDYEKDEHGDSFEEITCHCVEEKTERDLAKTY